MQVCHGCSKLSQTQIRAASLKNERKLKFVCTICEEKYGAINKSGKLSENEYKKTIS